MRNSVLCIVLCFALPLSAQQVDRSRQQLYRFEDAHLPAEERITDLLAHMTIEEKIVALGTNPSVPRLGVVGTGHVEGLHGLALGGPGGWEGRNLPVILTTQFPQARGLGQTWDPALIEQVAAVEGYETRYAYGKYHRGGLVVRAPNADLSRDPRWGRSEESYGEDPFLVGTIATAFSRGLQGKNEHYWLTASLLKHFLANSNEDGRDGSSSDFDTRLFHEYYAVPFRMVIEDGHANAFMASYNAWNKIPMTENPVLRNVVMKDWGFNGIICTDAGALTTVVVLQASFPFTTNWTEENIPAILQMTHNSEEQGNGLADVLFGDYSPAGRLTQTWVASMDQLPPMMDYNIRHGRTYLYLRQNPLYAFGFGLSYTTFTYSNLRFSSTKMDSKGEVTVSVDVKNTGLRAGDEVAQMYVAYPGSSVERPLQELKGFDRISLHPGETRTVSFRLAAKSIAYWKDEAGSFVVEPGPLEVRIGSSSDNIRLRGTINISR